MTRNATLILVVLCCSMPILGFGQPGGGGPATPPDVPITGIEILIAVGGALGLRSLLTRKNKRSE